MIRIGSDLVVLAFIVALCVMIALVLMLKTILPWLIIGGIGWLLYKHYDKTKPNHTCPECEIRNKVDHE